MNIVYFAIEFTLLLIGDTENMKPQMVDATDGFATNGLPLHTPSSCPNELKMIGINGPKALCSLIAEVLRARSTLTPMELSA